MKKLFILMVIATISTTSFAQLGVQAGITSSSLNFDEDLPSGFKSSSVIGFTLGIFTHVPLSTNFNFRPALNFTQKGGKLKLDFAGQTDEVKTTINYLEVPLDFVYKAAGGFFVGAGPALAYALSGKNKYDDNTPDEKLEIGSDENNDDLKAFEFSGNLLAGYQLANGLTFMLNYNLGLSNLNPSDDSDEDVKNRYFGIRIGYNIGAKKK